jgi:hypothetical protein
MSAGVRVIQGFYDGGLSVSPTSARHPAGDPSPVAAHVGTPPRSARATSLTRRVLAGRVSLTRMRACPSGRQAPLRGTHRPWQD